IARFLIILFAIGTAVAAQEIPFTLQVDVPIVSVNIQAQDPITGRAVTNLTKEDFTVFEDGKPQTIRNFSPADDPYNILVMFDCTGSIRNQWSFLRSAMDRFSESLRPQDRIRIDAFGAGAETLRQWTA